MDTTAVQRSGPARIAGIVGLVGALLGLAVTVYDLLTLPIEVSMTASVRYALLHLAAIIALGGLAALGAVGTAWWGRVGIGAAILGLVVLIGAEFIQPHDPTMAGTMFAIAPLVTGPGLVAAGVAVLQAKRWSGWRRFVPLACGAYLLVVFVPVMISTGNDIGFLAAVTGWDLGLAALGIAVAQEASASTEARARARARIA
ncbi:hypothetical protein [Actinomycetospora sp. NBC_00405]|uniref:hypothetical protein n=1 Tax=Actinomycetospora sp. NBC_00405 TaxID=2975952 RepID=UPI002E246780